MVTGAWAAGTVTQTITQIAKGRYKVTLVCTGDVAGGTVGTIPATATTDYDTNGALLNGVIIGKYLIEVNAFPTADGTAPDAASVLIKDTNSLDLLGSEDGATAYNGLNLIHATLPRSTTPDKYIPRAGLHALYYPQITGALTVSVTDQATAEADFTIELIIDDLR